MANIKLPTYRIIVPNQVFGKKTKPFNHPTIGEVAATQIIMLTKFRIPTQEEVIEFIRTSAKGIDPSSLEEDKPSEKDPKTVYILKSFPPSEVEDIARGDDDSLKHLRNHYSEINLQEGRIYLETFNGIVPTIVLDRVKELVSNKETEVYGEVIATTGVKKWNLGIRLSEEGAFPDILELEYLADRGVRDSDVFTVEGHFDNYQVVADQIRLLYNTLGKTGLTSLVCDTSYQFLEQRAASTVMKTAQCIVSRGVMRGLAEIIGQALGNRGGQKEQDPRGKPGNCNYHLN